LLVHKYHLSAIEAVIKVSYENKIPLFPGEGDSVERGGVATAGVDYYKLGEQTGKQALKILEGHNIREIPIETQKEMSVIINTKAAEIVDIDLPKELLEKAVEIIDE
ncbi:MAG TPA: sugar ABC transporter substrate-binding protein, partial [Thermoanaerobacterales bacterium]|nr:sugar ABC transporter substrate-binding protein [Thermoanaerobacterales bacterium]